MSTEVQNLIISQPRVRPARLPERLSRQWRMLLLCGDAAVVLFVSLVVLNGDGSRLAAAIVAACAICGVFWQSGLYKRSFAVYPHDEAYYTCAGVAIAAIPIALVLAPVAGISLLSIVLALVFCAIGTSAVHVRLHLERRTGQTPYAGLASITPGAWHDRESTADRLSKRAFDVFIAMLALLLFSPVMLLAALAIAIESGMPVFFRQQRVGENGHAFWILKFRTMQKDAGPEWARPGDRRITRVGALLRRTSLDELPQLFNVLRGEMSVVGPRPEMLSFAQSFAKSIPSYEQRHVVPPGITGWAQVYLKRNLEPSDMYGVLPYDLFYIEHASRILDSVIILKTAVEVLFHRAV